MRKPPRLAAGRARALGLPTRGTTNPNRLRRVDRWIAGTHGAAAAPRRRPAGRRPRLRRHALDRRRAAARLRRSRRRPGASASRSTRRGSRRRRPRDRDGPGLPPGGFECRPARPVLIRAANVLRQYDEDEVAGASGRAAARRLAPRRAAGRGHLRRDRPPARLGARSDPDGPRTVTFATRLGSLDRPSDLAERLPKALIHRNVPGEPVHAFLRDFDRAWATAAPYRPSGRGSAGRRGRAVCAERLAGGRRPTLAARRDHGPLVIGVRSVITATRSGEECFVSVTRARSQWNDSVRDRRDAGGERDGGPAHHR